MVESVLGTAGLWIVTNPVRLGRKFALLACPIADYFF